MNDLTKIYKETSRFLVAAIIQTANSLDMPDEEIEYVVNITFNSLTNMLIPECALIFNEELLKAINRVDLLQQVEKKELMEEIINTMKGKDI